MQRAPYLTIPNLSPYIDQERYETPKRDAVHMVEIMEKNIDFNGSGELLDLGCANGEFLYYLNQKIGPNWKLSGLDSEDVFLDVARSSEAMKNVEFITGDLTNIQGQYDVLTCSGTIQIFPEIEDILEGFLNATKDGGYLFIDGMFNTDNVDVIYQYRDNSKAEGKGKWRCDFNIHAQERIAEFLKKKGVKSFFFHHLPMDIDLPRKEGAPDINIYTVDLADKTRLKTHGGRLVIETHLLVIHK